MNRFIQYIKKLRIFPKVFLVTVLSIAMITVTITYSTLKMSERLFIETFSITNFKIVNQIKENIETFNDSVVVTANQISQNKVVKKFLTEEDTNALEMIKSYYNTQRSMDHFQSNLDKHEVGITLHGENGRYISTNRTYWPIGEEEIQSHRITSEVYENPTKLIYEYDQLKGMSSPSIIAAKAIIDQESDQTYGVMYITMLETELRKMYESYTSDERNVLIIDHNGKTISSNQNELLGQQNDTLLSHIKNIEEENLNFKNIDFMEGQYILLSEYLPSLDLYVVNLIDRDHVIENIFNKKEIILISLSIASLSVLILFIIIRRLTRSLRNLVHQISATSETNFNHYVDGSGSYETDQLATSFNAMLDEFHDYVDMLMESQKKERNAELAALQQQINPHFLYNTLASIKIIISQGNKEKAGEMINHLITLLKNTIGSISETNTVEQELVIMKNYTFINQVRYGERIRVNYYISPECLTNEIPKLIIQPFIENSFFHAFNKKTSGLIYIMIRHEADTLVCEINDNGDGMDVNKNNDLPNYKKSQKLFSGIGIKNVHERIQLLYGEDYGIDISSELGKGTNIKIKLPIIEAK